VRGIHHFVPVVHRGDAVGRHTLRLRDATRARGFESRIYVDVVEPETAAETVSVLDYPAQAQKGDVLVYQFATASYMAAWLTSRREALVINYHNVTPPELIAPWDNYLALGQLRAQIELRQMAPRTTLAIADSAYNERHLVEAGFVATAVVPPSAALETDLLSADARATASRAERTGARWLSIGRLAPNKAVEDTIAALMIARDRDDPDATLLVIGRPVTASYETALHRYVTELGLGDAVTFLSRADDAAVATAYAEADVLVVTSEHEGFCVPVVEAMAVGLPVVAYAQGALPEVLGQAGVVVDSKSPYALAAAIARVTSEKGQRATLAEAGHHRIDELGLDTAAERFVDLLSGVAEREGVRR
jgi:glycosyltransferase involved in cell wall biosynthesis